MTVPFTAGTGFSSCNSVRFSASTILRIPAEMESVFGRGSDGFRRGIAEAATGEGVGGGTTTSGRISSAEGVAEGRKHNNLVLR